MKKRRFLSILLSMLIIVTTLSGVTSFQVYADDPDVDDCGGECDTPYLSDDGPTEDYGYHLEPSSHHVSLGMLTQGGPSNYVPINITNKSTRAVKLIWVESDPQNVLTVDAPQDDNMASFATYPFYVKANTSAPAGTYNVTLIVGDASDPGFVLGSKVEISFTILDAAPYISSVRVDPGSASVATGSGTQFRASVQGGNNPDTAVTWSVQGQSKSGTTIDGNGYLRVDSAETSRTLQVIAKSVQDPSVYGTSNVSVIDTDYTLTVVADPVAGGNVNGGGTVASGGSMTVLAAPNIGYQFEGWYLNGSKISDQARYTQSNITSDMTLVAKFRSNDCYVTVNPNHAEAGVVTTSQFVKYGGSLILQASARNGWQFDCWMENGNKLSSDVKFTLNGIASNRNITAVFSKTQYVISAGTNPNNCGKVTGAGTYPRGIDVKLHAEPASGYKFKDWTLNGNVVGKEADFVVKSLAQDYCLVANFEKIGETNFTIHAAVCSNDGIISPAGDSKINKGGSMVYTITPKSGYRIIAVAVDNVQVGAVTSYTFTNVGANHTITAAFAPIEKAAQAPHNTKTPKKTTTNTTDKVKHQSKTDTVTPDSANDFDNQIITNEDITSDAPDAGEYYDYDSQEGIFQQTDKTHEELEALLTQEGTSRQEIGMMAIKNGYLQVAIYDEFDDTPNMTGGNFITNQYLPNAAEVVTSVLSDTDVDNILHGNEVKVNINIYDNSLFIDPADKAEIDAAATKGLKVGKYFEVIMMKTADENTETITETPVGLKICMKVPEDMKTKGRTYYVIRNHKLADGTSEVSVLYDEDDNPDTITITTDRFSAYAIAYKGGQIFNRQFLSAVVCVVLAVAALVVAVALGATVAKPTKKRHHRR